MFKKVALSLIAGLLFLTPSMSFAKGFSGGTSTKSSAPTSKPSTPSGSFSGGSSTKTPSSSSGSGSFSGGTSTQSGTKNSTGSFSGGASTSPGTAGQDNSTNKVQKNPDGSYSTGFQKASDNVAKPGVNQPPVNGTTTNGTVNNNNKSSGIDGKTVATHAAAFGAGALLGSMMHPFSGGNATGGQMVPGPNGQMVQSGGGFSFIGFLMDLLALAIVGFIAWKAYKYFNKKKDKRD